MEQIRLLSENLRHRVGLVPKKSLLQHSQHQNNTNNSESLSSSGKRKRSVSFIDDENQNQNQQQKSILMNNNEEDPYTEYPTVRDVSREAAIERLLKARKMAAMKGRHLTAEEELSALKGEDPRNVRDAIARVGDMYEDLMTLLTAGKTIRDALVNDTKKTVDELEAEMEKVMPKKKVNTTAASNNNNDDESSSTAVATTHHQETASSTSNQNNQNNNASSSVVSERSVADPDLVLVNDEISSTSNNNNNENNLKSSESSTIHQEEL